MSQEMKNKLENLSRLFAAWESLYTLDSDDADFAMEQIDKVIIGVTQELVELYRKSKS